MWDFHTGGKPGFVLSSSLPKYTVYNKLRLRETWEYTSLVIVTVHILQIASRKNGEIWTFWKPLEEKASWAPRVLFMHWTPDGFVEAGYRKGICI